MIFLSVGTQLPFRRLVEYMDDWAAQDAEGEEVFGQVAETGESWKPTFPTISSISLDEFRSKVEKCRVLVSHAGMGNIITALELGRPIVMVPRLAALGEHRNDHQIDTAAKFASSNGVLVANNYSEFRAAMREAMRSGGARAIGTSPDKDALLSAVRRFIIESSIN